MNMLRESGVASSSENSVSIDASNSEEDSSDGRKSPIEVEVGSDSGAPPCKQPRHKISCGNTTDESTKIEPDFPDEVDCIQIKDAPPPIRNRILVSIHDVTSSDDGADVGDIFSSVVRKKIRKRKKTCCNITKKQIEELVETISDVDSPSEGSGAILNDSDCSDTQIPLAVLKNLDEEGEGSFCNPVAVGTENDESYSSPMSNKSEKNMADFDDEDSPCEEELEQLAERTQCMAAFAAPRQRSISATGEGSSDAIFKSGRRSSNGKTSNSDMESGSGNKESAPLQHAITFRTTDVCHPGNTLLWDLLQDDKIEQLGEVLALEAEKALGTLLCFNTDRNIRTKFIEGCLQNLASNRSVIVSLRLLPKLFASFQQFRATDTHQITLWAERQHKMMYYFFNNLKHYANTTPIQKQSSATLMYSHVTEVQVRLQFLTSVLSAMGSPDTFRLNLDQIDVLWSWLSNDNECADCLFAWLQGQAKGGEQHALGIDALQHLYLKKLPELKPEGISMVALGLFQQLCSLARLAAAHYDTPTDSSLDIVGMGHLWKIALKANNTDVSLAAIQYINSYYMGQQLKLEKEFVTHCMNHLTQAADELNT